MARLRTQILTSYGAEFFNLACSLTFGIITARALEASGRGQVGAAWATFGIATLVVNFGISKALIARLNDRSSFGVADYLGAVAILVPLQIAAAWLILLAIFPMLPPEVRPLALACVIGAAPIHLLGDAARCIHRASMQIGILNAGTALTAAGRLVAILLLWRLDAISVVAVLAIEAAALMVLAFTALATIQRSIGTVRPRFDHAWPAVRSLLAYGFAFQAYSLAFNMVPKVSIMALHALRGDAATGHFVVAARLAEYIVTFTNNINLVIVPFIAQMAVKSDRKAFAALTCRMAVLILIPAAVAAIVLAPLAIPFLYGPSFEGSVGPFQILAVAMALATLFQFSGSLAIASGELRGLVMVSIAALLLGCAALAVLVPLYGATGAAVAVLAAYAAAVLLHFAKLRLHDGVRLADLVVPRAADVMRAIRRSPPALADGARP